ncbi:hypothetical protein SteCoe_30793 [Stentor coeruleus]|uniref:Deacetylase sirtuin-type domain-containing protein n=1 Tax=Stentor coeruleus TaxID=5963 RepID=A0A1R2B2W1_9CILI|nr:hypothetical protein SteCoe_30793 [Stentor coeruleus]
MNCQSCEKLICCPEHCCDWDNCRCKDCESCGGIGGERVKIPSSSTSARSTNTNFTDDLFSGGLRTHKKEPERSIKDIIQEQAKERLRKQQIEDNLRQAEIESKNQIERARHNEIIASSKAAVEKNKQLLESTAETIDRLRNVINGVKETEKKFKDFQDEFDRIINTGLLSCLGSFEEFTDIDKSYGIARKTTIEEIVSIISSHNSIAIITGAGVSAESGVFTYKNNSETWEIGGKKLSLQEVMNINILESNPLEFWQNIQYNRVRFASCNANKVHYALSDFIQYYNNIGRKASLITQNIDGLDRKILGKNPNLYEIHGNTHEMRCKLNCCEIIFPCPPLNDMIATVPMCPKCGGLARPNVLLYGEGYTEEWYRAETASEVVKSADVLIIIGTQSKCGFPAQRIREFIKSRKHIIEINVEPVIEFGNTYVLPRSCGEVVPQFVKAIKSKVKK